MKACKNILAVLCLAFLTTAGCQSELFIDYQEYRQQTEADTIDFVGGFIDKPINTRSTSLLADHTASMGVWGWQTTSDNEKVQLFDNQAVVYSNATNEWTYSPKKFWSNDSYYNFYAYAPHSGSTAATVTIDQTTGRFNIDGITLEGSNIMYNTPSRTTSGIFKETTDIDWMVDHTGLAGAKSLFGKQVTFNMQHILAKLNVKVRISSFLEADANTVTLDSLIIGTFVGYGSFEQKLDHTPDPENETDNAAQEWTIDTTRPRYSINGAKNIEIDAAGYYVIESLLIPQNVGAGNTVKITYTMTSGSQTEKFTSIFDLDKMFDRFTSGNNYTLIITIAPDIITFDAGSSRWDEQTVTTNRVLN